MAFINNIVAWCKTEREQLRQQIEMLNAGTLRTSERHIGSQMVDTTSETKAKVEQKIAELDRLLERHADGRLTS